MNDSAGRPRPRLDGARVRAILLDLDGTLLDTVADLAAAANAVRGDFGLAPLSVDRLGTFVGKGADKLVHRALSDDPDGDAGERFAAARQAFDRHYRRENGRSAALFPGVAEGLERFRRRRLALGCVTNKPIAFSEQLLAATGLSGYFGTVIGGDSLPRRKPDPLPLLEAARRLGFGAGDCLMVGDSANDARAARAAGMPVLILPYGYNEGEPVDGIDCDGIVASLIEIDALLE
jgi:phosphoglycolate phosphatase